MDPFTLTDAAGTFAFDGTQGIFTSADGATVITFVNSATIVSSQATEVHVKEGEDIKIVEDDAV